jgi:competence CoiA-like predicted nuclease
LCIIADVTIKPNWQNWIELANASGNDEFENDNFEQTFDFHDSNKFKKYIEENFGKTLVQTILNLEQIIDDHSKKLTIVPR